VEEQEDVAEVRLEVELEVQREEQRPLLNPIVMQEFLLREEKRICW